MQRVGDRGHEALDVEHGRARRRPQAAGDVEGVERQQVGRRQRERFERGQQVGGGGRVGGGESGQQSAEVGHGVWRAESGPEETR